MTLEYHKPGDFVVKQNDAVQQNGKFLSSSHVYFMTEGIYRRLSLQFDHRYNINRLLENEEKLILSIFNEMRNRYEIDPNH